MVAIGRGRSMTENIIGEEIIDNDAMTYSFFKIVLKQFLHFPIEKIFI